MPDHPVIDGPSNTVRNEGAFTGTCDTHDSDTDIIFPARSIQHFSRGTIWSGSLNLRRSLAVADHNTLPLLRF